MRTLEELERLAYIEGRVEEARLIAEALDAHQLPCDCDDCDDCDDAEAHLEDALDVLGAVDDVCADHKQDHPMFGKILDMCREARR